MKDKIILVDCDGVLLHWEWSFDLWMKKHGYVKSNIGQYETDLTYNITKVEANKLIHMFNETVHIRKLPPYLDAITNIKKLHENHGFIFHAITSVGDDPDVIEARTHNLVSLFGATAFHQITCLDPKKSKQSTLEAYKDSGCWWIEDHPHNLALGFELGLKPLMLDHHYNRNYNANFTYNGEPHNARVYNWKHIYNIITY